MKFLSKEEDLILRNVQALYFYASWMPYHKKMLIMIDKIKEKYNIDFIAIDVDFFKSLCKRFTIESIPTVIILSDGRELQRITGLVLTSAFKSTFADICASIGESHDKEKDTSKKDRY